MCHPAPAFRTCPRARAAFTLTDLLMVVAIVAALVALLLPVATLAREAAGQTRCARLMGQLALATAGYCSENDGVFPAWGGGQTSYTRVADYGVDRNNQRLCPAVARIVSGFATTWTDLRRNAVEATTYRFNLGLVDGPGRPLDGVRHPDEVVLLLERFTVAPSSNGSGGTFDVVPGGPNGGGLARLYNPHRMQRIDVSLPGSVQDPRSCTGGTNYATISGRVGSHRLRYACGTRGEAWDDLRFTVW